MDKKLYRDERHKVIGGVCAGLTEYFSIDVSIIRLVFVLALILHGTGVLLYVILWIVLPKKDYTFIPPDYVVPPMPGVDPIAPLIPQPRRASKATLIGGLILIMLGAGLLLDEFDIIPDWDFERTWPVILVVVGLVLIFSRNRHHHDNLWQAPEKKDDPTTNDNPPIV